MLKCWQNPEFQKKISEVGSRNGYFRNSLNPFRDDYYGGVVAPIRPLKDQPKEYYEELDEFFGEAF